MTCGTRSGYVMHGRRKETPCDLCREAERLYVAQRYKNNPQAFAIANHKSYIKNRQKRLARMKTYYQNNTEVFRKGWRKRRALEKQTLTEPYTRQQIIQIYGDNCYLCNKPIDNDYHLDHIIPISKGGTDLIENIRPTHPLCNLQKGDKLITILVGEDLQADQV